MERLVMNLETGILTVVPLTEEEILALQPQPELIPEPEPTDGQT